MATNVINNPYVSKDEVVIKFMEKPLGFTIHISDFDSKTTQIKRVTEENIYKAHGLKIGLYIRTIGDENVEFDGFERVTQKLKAVEPPIQLSFSRSPPIHKKDKVFKSMETPLVMIGCCLILLGSAFYGVHIGAGVEFAGYAGIVLFLVGLAMNACYCILCCRREFREAKIDDSDE